MTSDLRNLPLSIEEAPCWLAGFFGLMFAWMLAGSPLVLAQSEVEVLKLDGERVHGQWKTGSMKRLVLSDSAQGDQTVPTESVLRVRLPGADRPCPPMAGSSWIWLASGERLRATLTVINETTIAATWNAFSELRPLEIPLEACRGVSLSLPADPYRQGLELKRVTSRTKESDELTLRNGDHIEGELAALSDAKFSMLTSLGSVATDVSKVQSLAFNPELVSLSKPEGAWCGMRLIDGSYLRSSDFTVDGEFLVVRSISGYSISLPTLLVAQLDFYGSRVQSLVDIPADTLDLRTYLTVERKPLADRNILNGILSVRGVLQSRGWGTNSGIAMSWELNGKYEHFRAAVGIDDAADGRGSVSFEVLLDGRSAWRSSVVTGRSELIQIPHVDVKGASRLTLRTDFADFGNVSDFADWIDPVLVRVGD